MRKEACAAVARPSVLAQLRSISRWMKPALKHAVRVLTHVALKAGPFAELWARRSAVIEPSRVSTTRLFSRMRERTLCPVVRAGSRAPSNLKLVHAELITHQRLLVQLLHYAVLRVHRDVTSVLSSTAASAGAPTRTGATVIARSVRIARGGRQAIRRDSTVHVARVSICSKEQQSLNGIRAQRRATRRRAVHRGASLLILATQVWIRTHLQQVQQDLQRSVRRRHHARRPPLPLQSFPSVSRLCVPVSHEIHRHALTLNQPSHLRQIIARRRRQHRRRAQRHLGRRVFTPSPVFALDKVSRYRARNAEITLENASQRALKLCLDDDEEESDAIRRPFRTVRARRRC